MFTSTFFFSNQKFGGKQGILQEIRKTIYPDNRIEFVGKNKGAVGKHIRNITVWKKPKTKCCRILKL